MAIGYPPYGAPRPVRFVPSGGRPVISVATMVAGAVPVEVVADGSGYPPHGGPLLVTEVASGGAYPPHGGPRRVFLAGGFAIDFTQPTLDPRVSFTRASTATFVGSNGLLQTAAVNAPCVDYDPVTLQPLGLFVEPARTNLVPNSESFAGFINDSNGTTITANNVTSPTGALTAARLNAGPTGDQYIKRDVIAVVDGLPYVYSIYLKAPSLTTVDIYLVGTTAPGFVGVSCPLSATLWKRFTTAPGTALGTNNVAQVGGANTFTPGSVLHAYGIQLEQGTFATSYIPTTGGSAATRAAVVSGFTVPAGVVSLRYTFDDSSTQTVAATPGAYQIPTTLNRIRLRSVQGLTA